MRAFLVYKNRRNNKWEINQNISDTRFELHLLRTLFYWIMNMRNDAWKDVKAFVARTKPISSQDKFERWSSIEIFFCCRCIISNNQFIFHFWLHHFIHAHNMNNWSSLPEYSIVFIDSLMQFLKSICIQLDEKCSNAKWLSQIW